MVMTPGLVKALGTMCFVDRSAAACNFRQRSSGHLRQREKRRERERGAKGTNWNIAGGILICTSARNNSSSIGGSSERCLSPQKKVSSGMVLSNRLGNGKRKALIIAVGAL